MAATVWVKSENVAIRAHRKAAAQRVLDHFGNQLPDRRLLCFLDDVDCLSFKDVCVFGKANRGLYAPIMSGSPLPWPHLWPDYVLECIYPGLLRKALFDHVIYLYGSTCADEVALTMIFAHELQHFVQHENALTLWAANTLIPQLPRCVIDALGLKWCDIPYERDARIVSRRTAEDLLEVEAVRRYIEAKIVEHVTDDDAADWECIQGLVTSSACDLDGETKRFFPRLKDYRSQLEKLLQEQNTNADFKDVDLDTLLYGAIAQ
jgi:hypothetical protein